MESLIDTFHIDVTLLIAQITNFVIVFIVLYFFAIKPLQKVMQDREQKIAKGLDDAKVLEKKILQAEEDYKNEIRQAREEAKKIIEDAIHQAELKKLQVIEQTRLEVNRWMDNQKQLLEAEKVKVFSEVKSSITDVIITSLEKIISVKIDKEKDNELIKSIIEKINI